MVGGVREDPLLVFGPVPPGRRESVAADLPTAEGDADLWELRDLLGDPWTAPVASAITTPAGGGADAELLALRIARASHAGVGRLLVANLCDALRARGACAVYANEDEQRGLPRDLLLDWGFVAAETAYPRPFGGAPRWVALLL
jgi:hypothetical protein